MMTRLQYLLTKLNEECSEVQKDSSKAILFGLDSRYENGPTNLESIQNEVQDIYTILTLLEEEFNFNFAPDKDYITAKKQKVNYYHKVSQDIANNLSGPIEGTRGGNDLSSSAV